MRVGLAVLYVTLGIVLFRRLDLRLWRTSLQLSVICVYLLTLPQQPSNKRDWAEDNSMLAEIHISGDLVELRGFRHNKYRSETDFDVHFGEFCLGCGRVAGCEVIPTATYHAAGGADHVRLILGMSGP